MVISNLNIIRVTVFPVINRFAIDHLLIWTIVRLYLPSRRANGYWAGPLDRPSWRLGRRTPSGGLPAQ